MLSASLNKTFLSLSHESDVFVFYSACWWLRYGIMQQLPTVIMTNTLGAVLQFIYILIYYFYSLRKVSRFVLLKYTDCLIILLSANDSAVKNIYFNCFIFSCNFNCIIHNCNLKCIILSFNLKCIILSFNLNCFILSCNLNYIILSCNLNCIILSCNLNCIILSCNLNCFILSCNLNCFILTCSLKCFCLVGLFLYYKSVERIISCEV